MFPRAEKQARSVLRWGAWFQKWEVGFEGEAKGFLFLASKLDLGVVWELGSLTEPLSQILLQMVVVAVTAAAAVVEVVVDDVGFCEWFGCFGFGFWVWINSNPL